MMELLINSAWLTPIAAMVGSIITYFVTKNNNKKDISMNDRAQLSKDQYQLISELREMMSEQKEETEILRNEIRQLQAVNISLTIENKELQNRIDKLNMRLDSDWVRRNVEYSEKHIDSEDHV